MSSLATQSFCEGDYVIIQRQGEEGLLYGKITQIEGSHVWYTRLFAASEVPEARNRSMFELIKSDNITEKDFICDIK